MYEMQLFKAFLAGGGSFQNSPTPVLTLLLAEEGEPLRPELGLEYLAELENPGSFPQWREHDTPQSGSARSGLLAFGDHLIEFALLETPLMNSVAEQTILTSHWAGAEKELMLSHRHQLILYYAGGSDKPLERMLALYKACLMVNPQVLLGVANEPAWTAHPGGLLQKLLQPDLFPMMRQSPPLLFWTGFVGFEYEEELWYTTRGHHLFQTPDLAMRAEGLPDPQVIQETFHEVFHYLHEEAPDLQAGDIAALNDNRLFEFKAADDMKDGLKQVGEFYALDTITNEDAAELLAESDNQLHRQGEAEAQDPSNDWD